MTERLLLRPMEAAEAIGVGRSKVYELLASGALPSVRIGASVRVPVDRLRACVDSQTRRIAPRGDGRHVRGRHCGERRDNFEFRSLISVRRIR